MFLNMKELTNYHFFVKSLCYFMVLVERVKNYAKMYLHYNF